MLDIEGLTTEVISAYVTRLQQQFLSKLNVPHMQIVNPLGDKPHARFLALKGPRASRIHATLAQQQVVTDVRGDVLRFGFGIYQDEKDVDQLHEILKLID
jgi:selenocysteine lyase/cysteine desulfurase